MKQLIPDTSTDARMTGLERFLELYLGPRRPEYGTLEDEIASVSMPAPLQRFFRFAGRWPGQDPRTPYANRFCIQDHLCGFHKKDYAPTFRAMGDRLVFVYENQGVWVVATERAGDDPPVWISENHDQPPQRQAWRQLEEPLSHFLVSFVLQEVMFGSEIVAVAPGALARFQDANLRIEPVWIQGEYAWDISRPSYLLVDGRFLVRQAPDEADGDDWYGCKDAAGSALLKSLELATRIM